MPNLDLTSCEKEPIHIPGAIQPHGALLVANQKGKICQVSENVECHLEVPVDEIIGKNLAEVFGDGAPTLFSKSGRTYDLTFHKIQLGSIVEVEPVGSLEDADIHKQVQNAIENILEERTIRGTCDRIVETMRAMLRFDRALVYRFLPDESGSVFAESVRQDLEPYLDLRYPASDIPKQARALYLRNWTRLICDVNYVPSPIAEINGDGQSPPLDMSDCSLRSVSPVHIEYLKNMGVTASMSISIIIQGRLWGLIAFHHGEPWYGSKLLRRSCELLGRVVSSHINGIELTANEEALAERRKLFRVLQNELADASSVSQAGLRHSSAFLALLGATGAAVVNAEGCCLLGATPTTVQVERLVQWLDGKALRAPYATESLSEDYPAAREYAGICSGVLAISYTKESQNYILWFRPELVQTVTWAGNPDKESLATAKPRIMPRTSFEAWKTEVRYRSKAWTQTDFLSAAEFRMTILESELTSLNSQLEERVQERTSALQKAVDELNGFTYSLSHDLRTPLRGMIGNSSILLEDYGEDVPMGARQRLRQICTNSLKMSALVDDLLHFARLGRQDIELSDVDVTQIAASTAWT